MITYLCEGARPTCTPPPSFRRRRQFFIRERAPRQDRHENIGKGKIGVEGFRPLVNDARFRELPGCLEYPGDDAGYRRNLKTLRSLIEGYVPPKKAKGRRT